MDLNALGPEVLSLQTVRDITIIGIKAVFVVIAFFYFVFSLIAFRQTTLLSSVLKTRVSPALKVVALINIFLGAFLLLICILYL